MDELVSSWEQSIAQKCSLMDPQQWMGAVKMRVQTADKNITIIHSRLSINVLINQDMFSFRVKAKTSIVFPVKTSSHLSLERNLHRLIYCFEKASIFYFRAAWCIRVKLIITIINHDYCHLRNFIKNDCILTLVQIKKTSTQMNDLISFI